VVVVRWVGGKNKSSSLLPSPAHVMPFPRL
jgi:hypothetical protein